MQGPSAGRGHFDVGGSAQEARLGGRVVDAGMPFVEMPVRAEAVVKALPLFEEFA
jgi:hypothetical protein